MPLAVLLSAIHLSAIAGGSGLNTLVVVNDASTNSVALGNYYCERRNVPPENLLRIHWPNLANTSWNSNEFTSVLLNPVLGALAARQLSNQIEFIVLSMDIPFQTMKGTSPNGTTSALFYGPKPDAGGTKGLANSFYLREGIFSSSKPASAPGYSFLTTMITAHTLAQAKAIVDNGVSADRSFPRVPVVLAKTSDPTRNLRYTLFDDALMNASVLGRTTIYRTNSDTPWPPGLLGCQVGLANFSIPVGTFIAGSIADNMTSFGGLLFGGGGQTSLLEFIYAGAVGSYGTVAEPNAETQKFPNPQVYFFQSRGYSLAESYYQSIAAPYLGLIVGDPLATPFQAPGSGSWTHTNEVFSGTAELGVRFNAQSAERPLAQVDLFVNGKFSRILTNVLPAPGNVIEVRLNGYPISYAVPSGATISLVATGLAAAINLSTNIDATRITAHPRGDRVELRFTGENPAAAPFYFLASSCAPETSYYRAVYLPDPIPPLVSIPSIAPGSPARLQVFTPVVMPVMIEASTNLLSWTIIATNLEGGEFEFIDNDSTNFSRRFYRVGGLVSDAPPVLSLTPPNASDEGPRVSVLSASTRPFTLDSSTDLFQWTPLASNIYGGTMEYHDAEATNLSSRFYRASPLTLPLPPVSFGAAPDGTSTLVRVEGAVRPYAIECSSNMVDWIDLTTNLHLGYLALSASSKQGSADLLSTCVVAARERFLESNARGVRAVTASGTIQPGSYLQFQTTKTNGQVVLLSATNQGPGNTLLKLTQDLMASINSSPALLGADGIVAEDVTTNAAGTAMFNVFARSPGPGPSAITIRLTGSSNLNCSPPVPMNLGQNLADLQPRNHLYISAGAPKLDLAFDLDTTLLPDGIHELSAVAYEGTHVRTQTRTTANILVTNSSLTASLSILGVSNAAPVSATLEFQVAANRSDLSEVRLLSTGGVLATATNEPFATFSVNGSFLGLGLHPFYALLQTTSGQRYRTAPLWLRLTNSP